MSNTDVASVKAQVGITQLAPSNFRDDVKVNRVISNTDVSSTKSQVGAHCLRLSIKAQPALPPCWRTRDLKQRRLPNRWGDLEIALPWPCSSPVPRSRLRRRFQPGQI